MADRDGGRAAGGRCQAAQVPPGRRANGARRIVRFPNHHFSMTKVDSVSAERRARTSESQLNRCAGFPQTDRASLGCRSAPAEPMLRPCPRDRYAVWWRGGDGPATWASSRWRDCMRCSPVKKAAKSRRATETRSGPSSTGGTRFGSREGCRAQSGSGTSTRLVLCASSRTCSRPRSARTRGGGPGGPR